jgi:hypothetical protein
MLLIARPRPARSLPNCFISFWGAGQDKSPVFETSEKKEFFALCSRTYKMLQGISDND